MAQVLTSTPESAAAAPRSTRPPAPQRYLALDAYRGFIMLMLISNGFGFHVLREHPFWGALAHQVDHVPWEGAVFWDLIQPAFMFMVGLAIPFATAAREAQGAGRGEILKHVAIRSLKLVLLSQILMCVSGNRLHFQLINVLSQIAFTYLLAYLIVQLPFRAQAMAAGALLAFHTALFFAIPGPEGAWSRVDNVGWRLDYWMLGYNYRGNYVTINFISSTVTTLFGAWTGMLIRSPRPQSVKFRILAGSALACYAIGFALTPWIPLVKRIWTASFTFYSTGSVLLMLLAFMWAVDVQGWRRWTFPLTVLGANSIFVYSISIVLRGWIDRSLAVFTQRFLFIGDLAPVAQATAVMLAMWGLCYWLYQRRIFLKL